MWPRALHLLVAVSGLFSLLGLAVLIIQVRHKGGQRPFARPRRAGWWGIFYAFGEGMLPWAKESTAHHLPSYFAGIVYHVGVFVSLGYLVPVWFGYALPGGTSVVLRWLLLGSVSAGGALFVKRLALPHLRAISRSDDYRANLLVDAFLLSALGATYGEPWQSPFLILGSLTLIYIPVGKVRHCVFFFYSRFLFGRFFGRRGVLPHTVERS